MAEPAFTLAISVHRARDHRYRGRRMAATENRLYCGDNLEILDAHVAAESVDLCYIDPPFFSQRDYYHTGPRTRSTAFTDRWAWDETAVADYRRATDPHDPTATVASAALLTGLHGALGDGALLAYLASLTRRITAIWRALARTGTLYLHCDPTAAHYLKLVCDSIFCPRGGEFRNEIIWTYETGGRGTRDFAWKHDVILRYAKSKTWTFDAAAVHLPRAQTRRNHMKRGLDADGRAFASIISAGKVYRYYEDEGVIPSDVWTDISHLHQRDPERLGYPTQKPLALLERIIKASSTGSSVVLDAYCGSGTTLAAAQRLGRRWIGVDLSPAAIDLTRARLGHGLLLPASPPAAPAATAGPTPG